MITIKKIHKTDTSNQKIGILLSGFYEHKKSIVKQESYTYKCESDSLSNDKYKNSMMYINNNTNLPIKNKKPKRKVKKKS